MVLCILLPGHIPSTHPLDLYHLGKQRNGSLNQGQLPPLHMYLMLSRFGFLWSNNIVFYADNTVSLILFCHNDNNTNTGYPFFSISDYRSEI